MTLKANPQHVVLLHYLRLVLEEAAKERIDVALLKGAYLIAKIFPADVDRGPMADVDFMVRIEDFDRMSEILQRLGFVPRESAYSAIKENANGYYLQINSAERILFEVHRYFVDPVRFPIDYERIWSRSTFSSFEGIPCRAFSPEDHFLHISFHAMLHCLEDLKRPLLDLKYLFEGSCADLRKIISLAKEWQMTRIAWLTCSLLASDVRHSALDCVLRELAPPRPIQSALHFLVPDSSGMRFKRFEHHAQTALLYPFLFDSPIQLLRFMSTHPAMRQVMHRGLSIIHSSKHPIASL